MSSAKSNAVIDVCLHRVKKRFDEVVIGHLAGSVHAWDKPEFRKALLERRAGVFSTSIGVEDQAPLWSAAAHGAIKGAQG
jgi:hypothetical protein